MSLNHFGVSGTMYAGVVITLIGLVACIAWAEETRGRSLDDVDAPGPQRSPAAAPDRSDEVGAASATTGD
ncbi:hypothetical protein ABZV31_33960 [Streptomyces sp. NPDC005202]|uniref:hypothetical protein n=1 Tax=Streptomyces sp. NPDC005202 TaxID=3157021 RepID=UPI0033A28536